MHRVPRRWTQAVSVILIIAPIAILTEKPANAGVMLEGFYSNCPTGPGAPWWWWDHIAAQSNTLANAGISAVYLPPPLKCASGVGSAGYDVFDDYDLGSKTQKGTYPTHYGTRQQLERCCAMLHANSIQVYEDIVDNHRDGDDGNYNFVYADAYGNPSGGRFGKGYYDFHPNVPQDPNVPDGNNEISYGRDLAPVNGGRTTINGQSWVWVDYGLKQAGDWMTKALDLNGYRIDYARGISWNWLPSFLNYGAMNGKFAVSENVDGVVPDLNNWVVNDMGSRSSALDFPLRNYLVPMCNNPGSFNMATLDHAGLAGTNPSAAVTFVENHDTDSLYPITQNKLMAYAYILTSEGYPSVFYRDWSTDSGCYGAGGLQAGINNLIWIHEKIASGSTQQRWENGSTFVYERLGGSHLLTGLNTASNPTTITCATGFGANVHLHDYTGHEPDVYTDNNGNATITIPALNGGTGYVAYSVAAISGGFNVPQNSTNQEYDGAQDLDIKPADNTQYVWVGTLDVASGKQIKGALYFDTTAWTGSTSIVLQLTSPTGSVVATQSYSSSTPQGTALNATASSAGNYTFNIRSYNTPSSNPKPAYWLVTTYTAPQQ